MKKIIFFIFGLFSVISFAEAKKNEYELIYNEWKKIFSENKEEVVVGIYNIGEKKLKSCIPIILTLLDDDSVVWLKCDGYGKWTKISKEVKEAVIKIGKDSLKYILNLLKDEYPYVAIYEGVEQKLIDIISKITEKKFENIEDCKGYLEEIFSNGTKGES